VAGAVVRTCGGPVDDWMLDLDSGGVELGLGLGGCRQGIGLGKWD